MGDDASKVKVVNLTGWQLVVIGSTIAVTRYE
jgi:menaquinone-dependent protoporphyrinogen IX oxidase